MSNIVVHKPIRDAGRYVGRVDFTVRGYPVAISIEVDERAIADLRAWGLRSLESRGIRFAGKACCTSCAKGSTCESKKPVFGVRMPRDVEEVAHLLERNSELADALGQRAERQPEEIALYQEVLLAAADPYRQDEVESWFFNLRSDASNGDPIAVEVYATLNELSQLDDLRKRYFDNDLLARWEVESLDAASTFDPYAARAFSLWGALGSVSTMPLLATYNIAEGLAVPQAAARFGQVLTRQARTAGV